MMEWIARFWSMVTPSNFTGAKQRQRPTQEESITSAYIKQSRQLVELLTRQQETLDRIVAAKFDRPIAAQMEPVKADKPPDSMLFDTLFVESDAEFLEKTKTLN